MNVFVQGMRRSGTTILFDLFWEDGRFDCYYEPLAAAKKAPGGGSGVHGKTDFFQKVRECRDAFLLENSDIDDPNLLNYGAPREAILEFLPDAPAYIKHYIQYLLSQSEETFIKFTRMYCKIPVLFELDPSAKLIHIVRDPKLITMSYLFGKNQKNRHRFDTEETFFGRVSSRLPWSSDRFSEYLLSTPEYAHLKDPLQDFMRILLVWDYTFRKTYEAGHHCFGENYLLLRHEDLVLYPEDTIAKFYQFMGKSPNERVLDWARNNINRRLNYYAKENPAWAWAYQTLGMADSLALAGYNQG